MGEGVLQMDKRNSDINCKREGMVPSSLGLLPLIFNLCSVPGKWHVALGVMKWLF